MTGLLGGSYRLACAQDNRLGSAKNFLVLLMVIGDNLSQPEYPTGWPGALIAPASVSGAPATEALEAVPGSALLLFEMVMLRGNFL
jgi:hypothetical protein